MSQIALPIASQQPASMALLGLIQRRSFQLATLLLWAILMNREGFRVPNGNELVYLLYFYKAWHPHFLATDWTFQETTAGHAIFNYTMGWLTWLMPLQCAGWLGRGIVWIGAFLGLMRVGGHFKIPSWAVWVGILLWLIQHQAPVAVEWMIGTFEAKCVAYIFLLLGIDAALRSKNLMTGVLCGLAFTFHTAVGLWGGTALGVAVLFQNPVRETFRFSIAAILFALPGLICSMPLLFGPHAISPAEAKFIVEVYQPNCLDPLLFPRIWLLLMPVLLVFSFACFRWLAADRSARMLFFFEISAAAFFLLGAVARLTNHFELVALYPMRVFAVFVLLLFYWRLARVAIDFFLAKDRSKRRPPVQLLVFGTVLFFAIPSPLLQLHDMLAAHVQRIEEISTNKPSPLRSDDTAFRAAAGWIQENTPEQDVVMAPPWRSDACYFTQRPLIASWHAPRYDAITQWKSRIEDLAGDVSIDNDCPTDMGTRQRLHYQQLSSTEVLEIARRYHAKWLITTTRYPFQLMYESGSYAVYRFRD